MNSTTKYRLGLGSCRYYKKGPGKYKVNFHAIFYRKQLIFKYVLGR